MTVIKADHLGFCKGVGLAVSKATKICKASSETGKKLYFFGELVHNSYIISMIEKAGGIVIHSLDEIAVPGIVVIRAHGITDAERQQLLDGGNEIIDATCPVVLKGQSIVRSSDGPVIIFGYPKHSEVNSLEGAAKTEVHIISDEAALTKLDNRKTYTGVVQTTFSSYLLESLMAKALELGIAIELKNSICSASTMRRQGILDLKGQVDAFIIVGDQKSANTKELVATAERCAVPVYFTDGMEELPEEVYSYGCVGVSAGASTPAVLYEELCSKLEKRER